MKAVIILLLTIFFLTSADLNEIKLVIAECLQHCKDFQLYSDNETLTYLLQEKLHSIRDIEAYIFQDNLIRNCLHDKDYWKIAEIIQQEL